MSQISIRDLRSLKVNVVNLSKVNRRTPRLQKTYGKRLTRGVVYGSTQCFNGRHGPPLPFDRPAWSAAIRPT
jgi:hypothetical protein